MKIGAGITALAAALLAAPAFAADVTGDYVEARSASVYAGACHFNGELTTAGREAVLAFRVGKGSLNGVALDGLSVVAVVAGTDNLADAKTARRSVIYVSEKADPAQRAALVSLIREKAGAALGTVAAVKSAPQSFTLDAASVRVQSGDAVRLSVSRYPCKHCVMPAQTWYAPFTPITDAMVAQGVSTGFRDDTLKVSWSQGESDNVFVGTFSR
jgi:hypothetical protein